MARNTDPKCRQCRREGEKLFLKGDKCLRNYNSLFLGSGLVYRFHSETANYFFLLIYPGQNKHVSNFQTNQRCCTL